MIVADIIIFIINCIFTIGSIIASIKAFFYSKKSKHIYLLNSYVKISSAIEEIQEYIVDIFRFGNEKYTKAKNTNKIVCDKAQRIVTLLSSIKSSLDHKSSIEISTALRQDNFDVETYFNSLISGKYIENNRFVGFKEHDKAAKRIDYIKTLIKEKREKSENALR